MRFRVSMAAAVSCLVVAVAVPAAASAHGTHLKAKMSGDQVVGAEGAPDGTGTAKLHLLKDENQICFDVKWDKIGNKQGLNIAVYSGAEGENGDEVVTLVDEKQSSPVEGCVDDVASKTLRQLNKSPHLYHVNVKNKKYSRDGAIRGQLKAV